MKWNPYRMWRVTIREEHAWAEVEISDDTKGLFGVWVFTFETTTGAKLREKYDDAGTLREAKKRGEAMAVELLQHAAQALGVV